MALETPQSAKDVVDRMVNDVEAALAPFGAKPAERNSWLNSLITALGFRIHDFYFALDQAAMESIPDTAVDNLARWASVWGISRIAGGASSGNAVATGTSGSTIPAGTSLVSGEGKVYSVRTAATLAAVASAISSITRVGTTATVTTSSAHGLASNAKVTITGATEPEYNVTDSAITVISPTQFTYEVTGSPSTPATGSPVMSSVVGILLLDSEAFGASEDQELDTVLTLESPVTGVDDQVYVDAVGLTGGVDRETDEALRERLLQRIQNPIAHFNVAELEARAKTVPGVTRVFVQEITPAVGQVTVYFTRDNDPSPVPDSSEVQDVLAVLEEIRPAHMDPADLIVLAPSEVTVPFTFTDVQPDTPTMRDAIEASLEQFFAERTSVGVDLDSDAYRAAIFNTIDTATGARLTTFTLSTPSGDVAVSDGEIAVLGSVVFP